MNDIHILVTMPQHAVFRTFFDAAAMAALAHIGTVHWNTLGRQYTQDELGAAVRAMEMRHSWGTPSWLSGAGAGGPPAAHAHTGGSVKPYVTDAVYGRGIRVVSGNEVFAESVAESVVAYALASLRQIPYHSVNLAGGIWPESFANRGLLDRSVGIVGYGMIARYVVGMLAPFHCPIKVFSRHIGQDELDRCHMKKPSWSNCSPPATSFHHSGMTP
jgi:phosphoglycerate dehydrogenase-like enzyme